MDDTERDLDREAPFVVQDISEPMYRQFIHEPIDEEMLVIKAELLAEDEKIKEEEKNMLPQK